MFSFYINYSLILILILTILSSNGFVSAQEIFATIDNDIINAVPLNHCIIKGSNSGLYKFFNRTHVVEKLFSGSTTCNASYISAQYFIEGFYTNIQKLIDDSVAYQMYSYDTKCDVVYLYTFFKGNGCNRALDNYFLSITVFSDKLIELNYHVTNEKDVCDFAHNSADNAMIYYDNLCITGTGGSTKVRINQNKVLQCEENATDELGIIFVFIFMCLILF